MTRNSSWRRSNGGWSGHVASRLRATGGRPQPTAPRRPAGAHLVPDANRVRAALIRELASSIFKEAHAFGTRALKAGDRNAFAHAIAVERNLIDEQQAVPEE